jgi:predicted DNA-binding antitoxin AbrB/MazE fold protein
MTFTVEAIYENGVLKPAQPLPLKEHETVRITIEPRLSWAERTAGMLQSKGDFEDLRRIVEDDEFGILEARAHGEQLGRRNGRDDPVDRRP